MECSKSAPHNFFQMKLLTVLRRVKYHLSRTLQKCRMAYWCMFPYNKQSLQRIENVVWFGAYGNTNIGDGLIFFALKKYLPESAKIMLSTREEKQSTDFGVNTFYKPNVAGWIKLIKTSDLVLLGGGGLFEYYKNGFRTAEGSILGYLLPLVKARSMGKPYAIVGMGCNNIRIPDFLTRFIFKRVTSDASFIVTRDQKSASGFKINGTVNSRLIASFDPVFNYSQVNNVGHNLTNKVGFLLWPYYMWPHFHATTDINEIRNRMSPERLIKHRDFVVKISTIIKILKENGITCIFPVFHFSDKIMFEELDVLEEYSHPSFKNYFEALQECDIVVTMRYHGQITSLLNGKPIISILVQEKMEALVENFNLQKYALDIDEFTAEQVTSKVYGIYANYTTIANQLATKTTEVQNSVRNTYNGLFQSIQNL